MINKIYKRILNAILRQYYRRLYSRLFWSYASKSEYADFAARQANEAFFWLTGEDWENWL